MTVRAHRLVLALATVAAVAVGACTSAGATTAPTTAPTRPSSAAPASARPSAAPQRRLARRPPRSVGSASAATGSGGTASAACPKSAPAPAANASTSTATIETPKGNIVIKVDPKLGPHAAANFVALAECGYYDGVIFHRLMPGFVIQGGDGQFGREPNLSDSVGQGGPGYEFADDPVTVPYKRGTVAMANSGPNTNGSQFFIVLADSGLDPNYSVFGEVTSGMDVVDAIAAGPNSGGQSGRGPRSGADDEGHGHHAVGSGRDPPSRELRTGDPHAHASRSPPTRATSSSTCSPTGAPKAANNFIDLARKGFYNGVIFHRIVPGFVIQGGDPTGTGRGGPGYQFEDEPFSGDYYRGTVAMANAGPEHERLPVLHLPGGSRRQSAEELHDLRTGDEGHGRGRPDRGRQDGCAGSTCRTGEDPVGERVGRRAGGLRRGSTRRRCKTPSINVKEFSRARASKPLARSACASTVCRGSNQPAAPDSRSWVGRVRVVGAADVIDALEAWQKTVRLSGRPFTGTAAKRLLREPLRFLPDESAAGADSTTMRSGTIRGVTTAATRPPLDPDRSLSGWIDVNTEVGPAVGRAAGAPLDALLAERDSHGVGTSLVRSRAALLGDARDANRALLELVGGVAGLLPIAVVAPDRSDSDRDVASLAPHVAGWWLHPGGAAPGALESLATERLLATVGRTGKPLFVSLSRFGDASRIGRATALLGVPVVLVGTHYGNVVDTLAAATRYGHLYIETSSMAHLAAIETAVREVGAERVLLGTGAPRRAIRSSLNAIAVAKITDDAKRDIAAGNAARLFGLTAGPAVPEIVCPARAIDVHAHLGPNPQDVPQLSDLDLMIELRRQTATEVAIASSVEAIDTDLDAGNRRMVEACARIPGLLGHLVAYPDDVAASREQIRRWGSAPGVVGVKIGCEQSQHTATRAVSDLFDVLADYGRPVKIHNDGPGWAEALLAIARRHPRLPIIVAHGGLGSPSREGAALTEQTENIYLEMCSSFADLATVREVARRVPRHKFMFGTDAPLLEPAFVLGTYQDAGVPQEQERSVYWDNAARLFGIGDRE